MINPAEIWENAIVPVHALVFPKLIDVAEPQPGERILDVGCGTGNLARRIAPQVGPSGIVMGLDSSPAMLAVAADRARAENLSIEWIESSMESMPVPDKSVDLILGSQALQFCSDRQAAVSEMYRVLDDGGRVVQSFFQAIEKMPVWTQFSISLEKHLGTSVTQIAFSLDAVEAQSLLAEAGFSNITIEPYEYMMRYPNADDYAAMQVPGAAAVAGAQQMSEDELSNLISVIQQEMQPTIAEFTEDGQLLMPAYIYIARAVRS